MMMKNKERILMLFLVSILQISVSSCSRFLEIDPPSTSVTGKMIFTNDAMATAAVTGIYSRMHQTSSGFASGTGSLTFLCGLSADELLNYSTTNTTQVEFYNNQLSPSNTSLQSLWSEFYTYIYSANAIIEGLHETDKVSSALKKQLEGEALFIRAFCHFYLLNLFGDIPFVNSSDYRINQYVSKMPSTQVYTHVVEDLIGAKNLLDNAYINNQRTRINKAAASAFLARVYLYRKEWIKAETEATLLIDNPNYRLEQLDDVFLVSSKEAIWQLQSVVPGYNTFDGYRFILTAAPTNVSLNPILANDFLQGDNRKANWVGEINSSGAPYFYPFKYKVKTLSTGQLPTEYLIVLRLAEQYLIRAEARIMQNGKIEIGINDLNKIRARARDISNQNLLDPLPAISTSLSQSDALWAVEEERKFELFSEWGHRWFDLKRTHKVDQVLGAVKEGWKPSSSSFPIPDIEIQRNPNL